MHRSARYLAVAAAISLGTGAALTSGTASAAAPARTTLPGSVPAWAKGSPVGDAPSSDFVHLRVYLNWRNAAAVHQLALDVTTPGSPSYGRFLSSDQFRQQFAPSVSDVEAVTRFLRGAGLSVVEVADNNRYVAAEGTVAQAQAAFSVALGEYATDGLTLRAPESAVSVPASLGSIVQAVVGLDQSGQLIAPNREKGEDTAVTPATDGTPPPAPSVGFRVGRPCSLWYGEKTVSMPQAPAYGSPVKPLAVCGYTPAQVRGLYGLDSVPADGSGQTVAFIGAFASPTLVEDVTTYSRLHNLPAPSITQIVNNDIYKHPNPDYTPGDYYGEETLDAEAIHTTAPGAKLLFVAARDADEDFDRVFTKTIDKHLANIFSISYGFVGEGLPADYIASINSTLEQAAATGIGVYNSSGDDGDDTTDFEGTAAVDFYASDPFLTSVGGTSAAIVPSRAIRTESYLAIDDPKSPLNKPGWKRSFEVAWQTGRDPLTGTLKGAGKRWTFEGTLSEPLPGGFFGGGGGGVSSVFEEPAYQRNAIGNYGSRVVPDISAVGDPNTGLLVGQTQQFSDGTVKYDEYRIGGTSLSAPLMAGMAAVADQLAGHPLGFLNPRIYGAYTASPGAYYDVDQADLFGTTVHDPLPAEFRVNYANNEDASEGLVYSLRTLEEPSQTLHSTRGFDTATGVGTPNGQAFFNAIAH